MSQQDIIKDVCKGLGGIDFNARAKRIVDHTMVKDEPASIAQVMSKNIARLWITATRARAETTLLSFHIGVFIHLQGMTEQDAWCEKAEM